MRVPMMSVGTRSGVNWIRANVPPTTRAKVSTASVLATPGTPLEQHVAPGQQADEHALNELVLAHDDSLDFEYGSFQGVHLGSQPIAATGRRPRAPGPSRARPHPSNRWSPGAARLLMSSITLHG